MEFIWILKQWYPLIEGDNKGHYHFVHVSNMQFPDKNSFDINSPDQVSGVIYQLHFSMSIHTVT